MPIYEYRCTACGHAFEHLARRLSEKPPACPKCGAAKPAKQFSTFAPAVANAAGKACDACPSSAGACPSAGRCCGCGCG